MTNATVNLTYYLFFDGKPIYTISAPPRTGVSRILKMAMDEAISKGAKENLLVMIEKANVRLMRQGDICEQQIK